MGDPNVGLVRLNVHLILRVVIAAFSLAVVGCTAPTDTPSESREVFHFVRTVQTTPDSNFLEGAGGYIHYVPATDRFVIMLQTRIDKPVSLASSRQECNGKAIGYKEFTVDTEPTGRYGFIACGFADTTSRIIGNDMYVVSMAPAASSSNGSALQENWRLERFDAVSWKRLGSVDIPLETGNEAGDGPTISFVNGQIDVTGEYFVNKNPDDPLGRGSHHHFFTLDLNPLGKRVLKPPEYPAHCPMASIIQESGGDILLFSATAMEGDIAVYRFDNEWHFKEVNKLKDKAFFPTGSVTDGNLLYIAYTDTSNREAGRMYRNVRLAAFDKNWNLMQDVAVTNFINTSDTYMDGESPWVTLHKNRLYVSYNVSELDPVSGALIETQAYVNIYEITMKP